MIKSGLVNQRNGGGFEKGYPHQRDATNTRKIRPYVIFEDKNIGPMSDTKTIVPLPVSYEKIFSKTLTPDERLYESKKLKHRQLKRNIRKLKMYEKQEEEEEFPKIDEPKKLEEEGYVGEGERQPPALNELLNGVDESGYDRAWEEDYELRNKWYEEEMKAVDIVEPVAHQESFAEIEKAEKLWEARVLDSDMMDVVASRHDHKTDDIAITKENTFGSRIPFGRVVKKKRKEKSIVGQFVKINGVGHRKRGKQ